MIEKRCGAKDCQGFVADPGDAICPACVEEMKRLIRARGLVVKVDAADGVDVSDGYHTFAELYEHRFELWITLLRVLACDRDDQFGDWIWRAIAHNDGTAIEGWFLLGLSRGNPTRDQLTYHLPLSYWDRCNFADTLTTAPKFDGHTSADVLSRLRNV